MNSIASPVRAGAIVFLIALIIRVAVISASPIKVGIDPSEYFALAQNLRWHDSFSYGATHKWGDRGIIDSLGPYLPTVARAPLYPAMIAAVWWQESPPFVAVRIMQALLGAFAALFSFLTAFRLFGPKTAWLAGLAVALGPMSNLLTAAFVSESLFSFLLAGGLWAWTRKSFFLAGLFLGAATLTRAVLLPILLFVGVLALVLKFNRTAHAKVALAALLVVAPWTARNAMTLHGFVPVSTMGWGANILLGTRPVPYGSGNPFLTYVRDKAFMDAIESSADETEAEAKMIRVGIERIKEDPLRWFFVRLTQYPRLFIETPSYLFPVIPLPPKIIIPVYFAGTFLFLSFAIAGVFLALSRWREIYPLVLFGFAIAGAFFVGVAEERYSLALLPMTAVFASSAIVHLIGRLRKI
jgi:4-amino-4-deoxy-L-arabinose transferase-like glycosyltransferase